MTDQRIRRLCDKPEASCIFIDTSAILALLVTNPQDAKEKELAEVYEDFFVKILPHWDVVAIVSLLVMAELANKIESFSRDMTA